MALIKCPECGKEISDSAKKCIHCGKVIHPGSTGKKVGKIFLIIGIVSTLGSLIYTMATADERLRLNAYALTHNNYYPTSYYISSFLSDFVANGGIILAIIGIIILIVFRNKK